MESADEVAGGGVLQGPASTTYVGCGRRVVAALIDWLVLVAAECILALSAKPLINPDSQGALTVVLPAAWCAAVVAYFCLLESGGWQTTPGKRAVGLIVTDMEGRRLTQGRAVFRCLLKLLYGLPVVVLISLIIAIRSRGRQTFHDWAAGSAVLRQESPHLPEAEG